MPLNAAIGSALVSGGSSLIGSIIQAHAQNKANATYLKGIREVNEANKQLYEQQMRDSRTNWSLENSYNSPVAQLSRLRQAGINVDDMMSNGNSSQIQTVTASPNVAPNQTPTPNYGGILTDSIQSAFAGYRQAQAMELDKYNLYQKGIESQFFLRQKLNEINMQEAELLSKETLNESDKARLSMLRIDAKFYEEKLQQQMSINDETLKNLKKSGREIDKRIERDDALAAASIKNLDVNQAISWFNARSERIVARAQEKRVMDQSEDLFVQWDLAYKDNERKGIEFWNKQIRDGWYFDMDKEDRPFARYAMLYQVVKHKDDIMRMSEKQRSYFAHGMRMLFGFELNEIFSGSASVNSNLTPSSSKAPRVP